MTAREYEALVARVDELTAEIAKRRAQDLVCRLGCTLCCHVQLTLSEVEARRVREALARLDAEARERVRARAHASDGEQGACVMLEPDGACAIYADRPLVCRTQGHALLYPRGTWHEEAVFAVTERGEITWCPLNYVAQMPDSADVLEAERIDELLALANRAADAGDSLVRTSMRDLGLGA